MKVFSILIILIYSANYSNAQDFSLNTYLTMPKYELVVEEFCEKYNFVQNENNTQVRFAKKPEGWFVLTYNYKDDRILSEELFWQKNNYLPLSSFKEERKASEDLEEPIETDNKSLLKELLKQNLVTDFNRHPFFGYSYWAEDVIYHFEKIENQLKDTLLYGLGRAYGALATNMVTNQFNFKASAQVKFVEGGNCINSDEQDELIRLMRKSQYYFKRVYEINKDFCVIVGTIHTKMSNEYMDLFYKLWPLTSIEYAATFVPDGIYTANVLTEARNYLNSCDSNAIFFAWGDNDTYPLHYLQIKEHLREDVSIINMGMLGVYLWIDAQTRGWDNKGVVYSIPFSSYKEGLNYISIKTPELDRHILVQNIPSMCIGENRSLEADYIDLPFDNYTIKIDLSVKSYISQYELAALDIIVSNPLRPICFSQEVMTKNLGLQENVQFNGLTYSLIKKDSPTLTYDLSKMRKYYSKYYSLDGFDNPENFSMCDDTYQNALGYYVQYHNLLKIYAEMLETLASIDDVKLVKNQLEFMTKNCCFELGESYASYKKYLDDKFTARMKKNGKN